jgi:hypothetical protein
MLVLSLFEKEQAQSLLPICCLLNQTQKPSQDATPVEMVG